LTDLEGTAGRQRDAARGQTTVEFALVVPLFFVLLFAVIEFAFVLHASLALAYASRDGALIASESGNTPGGDCLILSKIEEHVDAPANRQLITAVEVFWSDQNGNLRNGARNVYSRTGSMPCTNPDGTTFSVPYSASSTLYPEASRCNILAGCGGGHNGVDTIGVRVAYRYIWHTPLSGLLGSGGTGWILDRTNAMRMEPVL
jgi:hypothetical protein